MKINFTTFGLALILVCIIVGFIFPYTILLGIVVWVSIITFALILFNVFAKLAFNFFDKTTFFKIKKNRHYCQQSIRTWFFPFYKITKRKKIIVDFMFITYPEEINAGSWNKLNGLRFGLFKDYSARLAWRVHKDKEDVIEVAAYYHINGKFVVDLDNICEITEPFADYSYTISQLEDDTVRVRFFNDEEMLMSSSNVDMPLNKYKYLMFAYYGGVAKSKSETIIKTNIH